MSHTACMPRQTSRRRTSEEVRTLVIHAARDLFGRQGYEATTMRAVSGQAGVSFPLLFTHFESKEGLFEAAVSEPFTELLEQYEREWRAFSSAGESEHVIVSRFVRRFYDLARDNRALLLSCASRRATGSEGPDLEVVGQFAAVVQRCLQPVLIEHHEEMGWRNDPMVTVASCIGAILGVALLDDLLFPPEARRPTVDHLVGETTNVILYGLRVPPAEG